MKIGDYVRTNNGLIGKILGINKAIAGIMIYKVDVPTRGRNNRALEYSYGLDYTLVFSWQVIKSSSNIIDLIEVGDYVNGHLVQDKNENFITIEETSGLNNDMPEIVNENEITSIVTKEQFESMEYKI